MDWQHKLLKPFFDKTEQYGNGESGGVLAQVWDGGGQGFLDVRLIPPEVCLKIQEATGVEPGKMPSTKKVEVLTEEDS